MLTSIARAALPPLVAVVTLPIILGRVSLSDYGLWATITGPHRRARDDRRRSGHRHHPPRGGGPGADDVQQVTDIGRHGISVALRLALVVMPLTALAGVPIIHWVAPAEDFALGIGLWLGVVVYQTIGWYYALLAAVVTGLQRGDLANSVNAVGRW